MPTYNSSSIRNYADCKILRFLKGTEYIYGAVLITNFGILTALRCDAHFTHEHPVCALPDLNHGSGEGKGSDKHNLPHSTRSGSRDTKKKLTLS